MYSSSVYQRLKTGCGTNPQYFLPEYNLTTILLRIQSYDSSAIRTLISRFVRRILCNLNIVGPSRKLGAETKHRGTSPNVGAAHLSQEIYPKPRELEIGESFKK